MDNLMDQINNYEEESYQSNISLEEIDRRKNMVNELKNKFEEVKFIEEEKNSYQNVLLGVDELIFLANRL